MNRRLLAALAAVTLTAGTALAGETYAIDKGHSQAGFSVRHLGISKVPGRFTDFEGTVDVDQAKPEASKVEFTIKAASIDTNEANRDKHLRSADFFDVEKFPTITFKSTKVVSKGKDKYDVTGSFTLHGVTKEITLPVTVLGFVKDPWGNQRVGFETAITLNRKDYGLVWNKTLDGGGLLVGDDVDVTITVEAAKKKETASN
jgi:polyisoprenoid-binding protein YceI